MNLDVFLVLAKGGTDCGIQSFAAATKNDVILKNLSERSKNSLKHERAIEIINRTLDRSRRGLI